MDLRLIAVLPLLLLPLAACGEATEDEPSAGSTAASPTGLPACEDVWVDGETLPEDYAGCFDGTADVTAQQRSCSIGQPLVTYDDMFYAMAGARINEVAGGLEADEGYQSALMSCTG